MYEHLCVMHDVSQNVIFQDHAIVHGDSGQTGYCKSYTINIAKFTIQHDTSCVTVQTRKDGLVRADSPQNGQLSWILNNVIY